MTHHMHIILKYKFLHESSYLIMQSPAVIALQHD